MHESSLARKILELSLAEVARASGAGEAGDAGEAGGVGGRRGVTVRAVRGRVAETESLSRESLELHFHAHAVGTPAAHARLEIELVHVEARCRACGATYLPEHHVLLCTQCGSTDGEELGATGLWIESIDVTADVTDEGPGDVPGEDPGA